MLSCQNINILLTDRFYHIFPIAGSGQKINSLVRSRLYRIKKSRKQVKRKISSAAAVFLARYINPITIGKTFILTATYIPSVVSLSSVNNRGVI